MANSAAYVALRDDTVTLQNGSTRSHLRIRRTRRRRRTRSVLSFVVDPFGDNEVSLEWDLDGTNIETQSFNTSPSRALQEISARPPEDARRSSRCE